MKTINGVNIFDPIGDNTNTIIEAFVTFYGEKYRDRITSRINNTTVISLPRSLEESINYCYKFKKRQLNTSRQKKYVGKSKTETNPSIALDDNSPEALALRLDKEKAEALELCADEINEFKYIEECYKSTISELSSKRFDSLVKKKQSMRVYEYMKLLNTFCHISPRSIEHLKDDMLITNELKADCIALFKAMGHNHGENFNKYLQDELLMKKVFNSDYQQSLDQAYADKLNNHLNSKCFSHCKTVIESLDIKGGNRSVMTTALRFYTMPLNFGACCLYYMDSNNRLKSLMLLPSTFIASDSTIIHEFNHIIESDLVEYNQEYFHYKCGFEACENYFSDGDITAYDIETAKRLNPDRRAPSRVPFNQHRQYEKFNEVINEAFACGVVDILHNDLNTNLNKLHYINNSSYQGGFPLLFSSIKQYKRELVNFRMGTDPFAFAETIGGENYKGLAYLTAKNLAKGYYNDFYNECIDKHLEEYTTSSKIHTHLDELLKLDWSPNAQQFLNDCQELQEIKKQALSYINSNKNQANSMDEDAEPTQ